MSRGLLPGGPNGSHGPADGTLSGVTLPRNADFGTVEVEGGSVPRRTVAQCRVCASAQRDAIESMLLSGRAPSAVANAFVEEGISARNVSDHYANGHCPVPLGVAEKQRRSDPASLDLVEAVEGLVEPLAGHLRLATAVVESVSKRVASGDLQPNVRDGLAAAEMLGRADAEMPSGSIAEWHAAFVVCLDSIRAVLDPEQWMQFINKMWKDPRMRAILEIERQRTASMN